MLRRLCCCLLPGPNDLQHEADNHGKMAVRARAIPNHAAIKVEWAEPNAYRCCFRRQCSCCRHCMIMIAFREVYAPTWGFERARARDNSVVLEALRPGALYAITCSYNEENRSGWVPALLVHTWNVNEGQINNFEQVRFVTPRDPHDPSQPLSADLISDLEDVSRAIKEYVGSHERRGFSPNVSPQGRTQEEGPGNGNSAATRGHGGRGYQGGAANYTEEGPGGAVADPIPVSPAPFARSPVSPPLGPLREAWLNAREVEIFGAPRTTLSREALLRAEACDAETGEKEEGTSDAERKMRGAERKMRGAERETCDAETETRDTETENRDLGRKMLDDEIKLIDAERETIDVATETCNAESETQVVETPEKETESHGASGGEQEANDGKQEANDAEQEANDGEQEANNAEQEANDGEQEANDGEQEANNGEQEANDGEQEANNGEQEANNGEQEANDGEQEANDGEQEANDGANRDASSQNANLSVKVRQIAVRERGSDPDPQIEHTTHHVEVHSHK